MFRSGRSGVVGEECEWIRVLNLGFTHPVGTGVVLDVCLSLGCDGVGGVSGGWVVDLDQGLKWWGGIMSVSCECGFYV